MAMITPPALVTGAPRIPLPFGLFSVFSPRGGSADRWEAGGVTWETLSCEPVGGIGAAQCDDDDTLGLPRDLDHLSAVGGDATPFTVYGHHTCSPIGNTLQWAQQQAEAHLTLREEARVEQALWTGDLGNVPNFAGANDYAAPEDVGTFKDVWLAVSTLEQYFAETYGSLGVLHMSRRTATYLTNKGSLESRGGRLYTSLGTPVVAGTGYGDDAIVMTAQMFGYRSDIYTNSSQPYDLLDRQNNDLYAVAERSFLIGFDSCGLAKASIEIVDGGGAGVDGKSAYDIAVDNGFEGSEQEWLESLKGEQGDPGAPGKDGDDGVIQSITAGDGITVDDTDPANPTISTTA